MTRKVHSQSPSNIETPENVAGEITSAGLEPNQEPRPKRSKRRSKEDRGLPDDSALAQLAEAYLKDQHKLYPRAQSAGALPPITEETIREMVEDFKHRHRGGAVDISRIKKQLTVLPFKKAGGAGNCF